MNIVYNNNEENEIKINLKLNNLNNPYEIYKDNEVELNEKIDEIYEHIKTNKIRKNTEQKIISFLADEYQFLSFSHSKPFIYKNICESLDFIEEYNANNLKYDTNNKFYKKIEDQYLNVLKEIDLYEIENKIFNIIENLSYIDEDKNILNIYYINKNIYINENFKISSYLDNLISKKKSLLETQYIFLNENISSNEFKNLKNITKHLNKLVSLKIYDTIEPNYFLKNNTHNEYSNFSTNNLKKDIIIINTILDNQNPKIKINEFINNVLYNMTKLKENGDLWLNIDKIIKYKILIEFFYVLSKCFESTSLYKSNLYTNDVNGNMLMFKKFNNIGLFNNILILYQKKINLDNTLDKSLENNYEKHNIKNDLKELLKIIEKETENDDFENKNESSILTNKEIETNKNKYVESFIEDKIDKKFLKFIDNIYLTIKKLNELYIKKIHFIHEKLFIKKMDDKFYNFFNFISKTCLEWCKENNYIMNDDFLQKILKNFTSDYFKFKFFPKEKGVDIKKISLTYESVYSVSSAEEAEETSLVIKKYFPNAKTIIDATSNVGGNTINFAQHFEKVYSIEIDEDTYEALKRNTELYRRNNVVCINGDYTLIKDIYKADLIFFDPPWGGIYYRIYDKIDMYLSYINVVDILPENFIMKAPINYNLELLLHKFKNLIVYKMKNYLIIINNDYVDLIKSKKI